MGQNLVACLQDCKVACVVEPSSFLALDPLGLLISAPVGQVFFGLLVGLDIDVVFEEAEVMQDF